MEEEEEGKGSEEEAAEYDIILNGTLINIV